MIKMSQEQRGAAHWFRRRGLPAVVRGRPDQLLVRALPAVVWLALSDALTDLLDIIDGDSKFEARMENNAFAATYLATLAGSLVLPALGAWLTARRTAGWTLHDRGFVPALVGFVGYVMVAPIIDHAVDRNATLLTGVLINAGYVLAALAAVAVGASAILTWAFRAALRQLRGIGVMTGRALPLLILVATFEFFTTEIWQLAAILHRERLWQIIAFFAVVGGLFLLSNLSTELGGVIALSTTSAPVDLPPEHPFHRQATDPDEPAPPLTRLERANMIFVLMATQALQALVFGMLVFVLFIVLGQLGLPRGLIKLWINHDPNPGTLFGVQIPITNELLQVSMFLAAFSALYFVVTTVTDAGHRKAFLDPVLEHLRVSIAARTVYLARYRA